MKVSHSEKTERIKRQVAALYQIQQPWRVFHGSTNSTRPQYFKSSETVDMSDFNEIIAIDTKELTAIVEPNVPMDKLVEVTLKHGFVPKVVMEFPGITVGGGVSGGAGESSSFKYGLFNHICSRYEIITPNGELIEATSEKNSDLYNDIAGTYGTLGIITEVDVSLIPAKKYVELAYIPIDSFDAAIKVCEHEIAKKPDYIDGILFAKNCGVIIVGRLTDEVNGRIRRFSRARDPWFYMHAKKMANMSDTTIEIVPIADYLFRYDRSAFWMGERALKVPGLPNNWLTRLFFDNVMHTRKMYEILHESGVMNYFTVQDLGLSSKSIVDYLKYLDAEFSIYPLWICPLLPKNNSQFLNNNISDTSMVYNVGVWSEYIPTETEFKKQNILIEDKLFELGGRKWLYAPVYCSRKEFWSVYDEENYKRLRDKYHAEYLPDIFSKVRAKLIPRQDKPPVFRAYLKAIIGRSKLRVR